MGANTTRVARVLVTNTTAANTGTDILTVVDGDVLLFDRTFHEVPAGATLQSSPDVDQLYVALGIGDGVVDNKGVQTRNIRKVINTPYKAPVPFSATITVGAAVNSTEYVFKIIYRDEHPSSPGHSAPRSYAYTSDASATAVEIAQGIADRVNADKANIYVTASVDGAGAFTITAKPLATDLVADYQRVTFDVAVPNGFSGSTITYNSGTAGAGIGQKVKELERNQGYTQRRLWPIPADTTRATPTGKYNLVTIEHYDEHFGDLQNQTKSPEKIVLAFATTDGTPSAKQAAFMAKLTSVAESAGVYVS